MTITMVSPGASRELFSSQDKAYFDKTFLQHGNGRADVLQTYSTV